jgi:ubiquitin C-terminal hydrolase
MKNIQNDSVDSGAVKLVDCLREFKSQETLDEENMWYCNNCKEHV